jgi:hypothetical protein
MGKSDEDKNKTTPPEITKPPEGNPPPPAKDAIATGFMKLRVLPHIELPHILSYKGKNYIFAPDEVVPAVLGTALLKNQSKNFQIAEGKPDEKLYSFRKRFQEKELSDLVLSLNDKQKGEVVKYIDKIVERDRKLAEKPE